MKTFFLYLAVAFAVSAPEDLEVSMALPINLEEWIAQSDTAMEAGDLDRALDMACRALYRADKQDHNQQMFLRSRVANIYIRKGWMDKALEEFQTLLDMGIESEVVYHNLGRVYQDKKEFPRADRYYTEALKRNPEFIGSIYGSAVCKIYLREYPNALHMLRKLENSAPQLAEVVYLLGVVLENMGKDKDAMSYYQKYLGQELHTNYAEDAHKAIARLQQRLKEVVFLQATLALVFVVSCVSLFMIFVKTPVPRELSAGHG